MTTPDFRPLPRPYKIPVDAPAHERFGLLVANLHHLYERFSEWWDHEAWEAQHALWSLAYVDDLLPEDEIQAALDFVKVPVGIQRGSA
jgi:hypothetical protein